MLEGCHVDRAHWRVVEGGGAATPVLLLALCALRLARALRHPPRHGPLRGDSFAPGWEKPGGTLLTLSRHIDL